MTADVPLVSLERLTEHERRLLLRLARDSIRAALLQETPPPAIGLTPALQAPAAAFVSLHCRDRLRGCIGTMTAEKPLHETVARMAVAAALEDPRFAPLVATEMSTMVIEISRLSYMRAARPEDVCPGVHGVSLICGEHRGVFLPQVAVAQRWDRETLLRELCRKALLPPDAWRWADSQLLVFVAEVFAEEGT